MVQLVVETFKLSLINSANCNIYANWLKKYAFEPYFYSNVLLDSSVKSIEVINYGLSKKVFEIKIYKNKTFLRLSSTYFFLI